MIRRDLGDGAGPSEGRKNSVDATVAGPSGERVSDIEPEREALEGDVDSIVWRDAESSWSVVRLRTESETGSADGPSVTAVGHLSAVDVGQRLRTRGEWIDHPRFGRQFRVHTYVVLEPDTLRGMERYLASGSVPGLGKVMAKRLVDRFGLKTLEVLESADDRICEVEGIGPKRKQRIVEAWEKRRGLSEIMIFLQTHGLSTAYAHRIYKKYGNRSVSVVRSEPYQLALDIRGIGFKIADRVAISLGIDRNDSKRVQAGTLYTLEKQAEQGHLYLPRNRLLELAGELLGVDAPEISAALAALELEDRIALEPSRRDEPVYLTPYWEAEHAAAHRVTELVSEPPTRAPDLDALWPRIEADLDIALAPEQKRAIEVGLTRRIAIITGGPGTGKTTIVRGVLRGLQQLRRRTLLAAPTGRAAKRLEEATGSEALTIHRLLEYNPRERAFQRNAERPLETDCLVVDEASMVDAVLFRFLLEALPPDSQLILVGDADQLPSVGPGQVFANLIASGTVPTVRLVSVFRQAKQSRIVRNAHRVHRGEMPEFDPRDPECDFFFLERDDPVSAVELIKELVATRLPRKYGFDPRRDIQVLTPMRKGPLGVEELNRHLQALLNADGAHLEGRDDFRVGDRIQQLRNNYDNQVYNGDIGWIREVHSDDEKLGVDFEGREVSYSPAELDELGLAYATSIHKSQGSEYPVVVLPCHWSHYVMLERNLLYTAITRARRLVVIVGQRRALERAVENVRQGRRHTSLRRLLSVDGGPEPRADG